MSYTAPKTKAVQIGRLALKDPVIAFSSVMASSILVKAARFPRAQRLNWIRTEMNKTHPGIGDDFMSKYRQFERQGKPRNQAVFDALRLTIANRVADYIEKRTPTHSAAGVGDTMDDIRRGMCTIAIAGGAAGGGWYGAATDNPAGSRAIIDSSLAASQIAGCNREDLELQARIAEANASAAASMAAGADGAEVHAFASPGALVALGVGGVALIGLLGWAIVRK